MKKLFAMFMALAICLSMIPAAFAAAPADAVIDADRLCSIDLYKYDLTSAEADGVWDNSYVSTGTYDKPGVNDILGNPNRVVDLGNGEVSYGYAIRGVEFTYARVADIYQYVGRTQDGTLVAKVLYGFDNMELLSALGLTRENRFAPADHDGKLYFTADALLTALRSALETNATGTKNALESIVKTSGTAMPETDSYGHSEAKNLPVGLYLVVETRVPETVTETTAPFLLSLPMTTVDSTQWMYDVCVYPKNGTSNPVLTKTVRESKESTGKNGGTGMIDDGFDHTATASVGDVVEYQIISHLPAITSKASYLTTYTFEDTICKGILYNRNDVVLEFFRDAACTDKIATWNEGDGNFGVGYVTNEDGTSVMTITMQENGLKEINQSTAVHNGTHESGYSQCYLRITYSATLTEDVILGNTSNDNEVVLTWKRTNTEYYDTLKDCCHVYVYGVDLEKQFSDEDGNFEKVQFTVCNDTDRYYVTAELKDGTYYVTGTAEEANATRFVPNEEGHICIRGMEDDAYIFTEVQTDEGYTLLKDSIHITITADGRGEYCNACGIELLTASATVDSNAVEMQEDNGSLFAIVPLTVVNTKGFDLPQTGDNGVWMYGVIGILAMAASVGTIVIVCRKKKPAENE